MLQSLSICPVMFYSFLSFPSSPFPTGVGNEGRRGKEPVWQSKERVQRERRSTDLQFQEVRPATWQLMFILFFLPVLHTCDFFPRPSNVRESKKSGGKKEEKKRKSAAGDKDKERAGGNDSFKSREFIETSESSSDSDHKSKSKRKKVKPVMVNDVPIIRQAAAGSIIRFILVSLFLSVHHNTHVITHCSESVFWIKQIGSDNTH